jgi:uncharacterized protein GlcG (DUF336 family)
MLRKLALSIDDAKKAAAACRAEAEKNKWNVVIAVLDDGGHLMYLERMDGTQKASSRVAVKKGQSSHSFQAANGSALEKAVASRPHRCHGSRRDNCRGWHSDRCGRRICRRHRHFRRAVA